MRKALVLAIILLCGCQTIQPTLVSLGLSTMPNPLDPQTAAGAYETYYDILDDVPLPRDMKVDTKKTYHSKHDPNRCGFLFLTGNVELNSLVTAEALTLTRDGWLVFAFFRGQTSMIAAQKDSRICVVTIGESLTSSWMMIWVTPRSEGFTPPLSRYATPEELNRAATGASETPPPSTAPATSQGRSSLGESVNESVLAD